MIAINRFKYNGYESRDFNLKTCLSFDASSGETNTFLNREAVASETYRGDFKRVHNYKYSEVLSPVITLIKEDFTDFTLEEQRRVLRWLTSKNTPSFLTVHHDDSNTISYEILGAFTEISTYKLGSGRVVGFQCTFESVSPYAFSALQTIAKDVSDPTVDTTTNIAKNILQININTDEFETAIYPRITIQQDANVIVNVNHPMIANNKWVDDDWMDGVIYYYAPLNTWYYQRHYTTTDANGNTINVLEPTATTTNPVNDKTKTGVIIKNTYTDNEGVPHVSTLRIANNTRDERVVLDGANRVVSSWYLGTNVTNNQQDVWMQDASRVFGDSFNWQWLPLYNGLNTIEVIGNCTITFEYREVRKVGEF